MQTKRFPARVVLTVTTGRLLTRRKLPDDNGIGDLYEVLNWLTSDNLFTHQLPRGMQESLPWLLRWFPELAGASSAESLSELDGRLRLSPQAGVEGWLEWVTARYGLKAEYDVPKIPADDHERKDALDELVQMRGTDEGIEIVEVPGQ